MATSQPERRILYHGSSPEQFGGLLQDLARAPHVRAVPESNTVLELGGLRCSFLAWWDGHRLVEELRRAYVDLVVFDLRCGEPAFPDRAARALAVLDALDGIEDPEDRYPCDRIVVLLAAEHGTASDALLLQLGARGIRRVLRDAAAPAGLDRDGERPLRERLAETIGSAIRREGRGRKALCLAGGGVSGIFFELGALKCLDDCMPGSGVSGFDMYFGISAGAVVSAPLAVGYSVDECMAAIAGEPGGRMAPLDLRLFRLGHINWKGLLRRGGTAARTTLAALGSLLRGRGGPSKEELLFEYADLVAPPFHASRFERTLRGMLEAPGATNDFRRLSRPLYIGATDQDERRHVLFGDEEHRDVPISRAIQASLSINPAFSATVIDGRYYEDGAVTRTSNFVEAIRRGATLILVLDPFVPFIARQPGFADGRGVLYNLDQDVRTVSYTRYENTRRWILHLHPEVSSFTFLPANRLRQLMSIRPMDHRPYLEIWRGAYLSTLGRVQRVKHRLAGDLFAHDVAFDLARAETVAAQLVATPAPRFADFFPGGNVEIKQPMLALDGGAPPRLAEGLV